MRAGGGIDLNLPRPYKSHGAQRAKLHLAAAGPLGIRLHDASHQSSEIVLAGSSQRHQTFASHQVLGALGILIERIPQLRDLGHIRSPL